MNTFTMPDAGLVVTVVFIIGGLYDLYLVRRYGTGSSISNFLVKAGFKAPAVTFVFGFVAGHLFGRMHLVGEATSEKIWYVVCAGLFGLGIGYAATNLLKAKQ